MDLIFFSSKYVFIYVYIYIHLTIQILTFFRYLLVPRNEHYSSFLFAEQNTETDTIMNEQNGEELEEESDDLAEFKMNDDNSKKRCVQPRWPTRVFAAECVRRIITTCLAVSPAHFDLQLAKELHLSKNKGNFKGFVFVKNNGPKAD